MLGPLQAILRALRPLARRPAFAIPAVAGLAIGIAASTAVFSVFSVLEIEAMGLSDPARLVAVWLTDSAHGQSQVEMSYDDWQACRAARDAFRDVALASSVNLDFRVNITGIPEHVDGTTVTGNFFDVLGSKAFVGRLLTEADDRSGAPIRVVISHRLWRTRFGGDTRVLGSQLSLGGAAATVIGVAAPEFDFPREVAMWAPLRPLWPGVEKSAGLGVFRSVARLAPGVSLAQAQARTELALRHADQLRPSGTPRYGALVRSFQDEAYGTARPIVAVLLGAVLLVLVIACVNAANLMLALLTERRHEMAVRAALGASGTRLARLLLSESSTVAGVAGVLGLLGALLAMDLITRLARPEVPGLERIALNLPVLGFGILLTVVTVMLFGLVPALIASSAQPVGELQGAGVRAIGGPSHRRIRNFLTAGEFALATMLAISAGLLVRSLAKLTAVDPGFRPDRVLTFRVTTELPGQESRRALYSQILERVRALPGVEAAGAVLIRPLSGPVGWDTTYAVDGQSVAERKTNPNGNYEAISPGYFRTMSIRMLAGRDFSSADHDGSGGVVIINEATARRHWPHGNAVGKSLRLGAGPKAPPLTVVGVVADVHYREWEVARPDFYVPFTQRAQHRSDFVVKTHADAGALTGAVRQAVFAADRNQPISNVTTMEVLVAGALSRARIVAALITALAGCAILLAAIGIYGVLSYSVEQRTREIGVRTALGATPRTVMAMVAADTLRSSSVGFVLGVGGALLAGGALQSILFGVRPADPVTYLAAPITMLFVAAAACIVPAWRAATMDPASALRL